MAKIITRLIFGIATDFEYAAFAMLAFGWIHGSTPDIPALGYWACFAIVFVLTGIVQASLVIEKQLGS